ncbi:MAG: hypothetical protein DRP09_20370 [Candidatus Thorarchaeota archaeon]|nr:MAG: hypothetical protein DRP09_20370 [Candidatus Thorarchaeota archaeon]
MARGAPDWTRPVKEGFSIPDRYSDIVTVDETGWVLLGTISGKGKIIKVSFWISTTDNVDNDEIGIDVDGEGISSRKIGDLLTYGCFGDTNEIWKLQMYNSVDGKYGVLFDEILFFFTSVEFYYNAAAITDPRTIEILTIHHFITS